MGRNSSEIYCVPDKGLNSPSVRYVEGMCVHREAIWGYCASVLLEACKNCTVSSMFHITRQLKFLSFYSRDELVWLTPRFSTEMLAICGRIFLYIGNLYARCGMSSLGMLIRVARVCWRRSWSSNDGLRAYWPAKTFCIVS